MSSFASTIGTQGLKRHSIWTLSAIGFLAYYFTVMWHEIIGHGSMMYLFGGRHFVLTSTSIDAADLPASAQIGTFGGRLITMSGAISTVVLGLALYPLHRILARHNANLTWRVFVWLLSALGVFNGVCYTFFSGTFGVGDWSDAIVGLPHHGLLPC